MKKFLVNCPVPLDQQPMNEYLNLKDSMFFFWTAKELKDYLKYTLLTALGVYSFTLVFIISSVSQLDTIGQIDIVIYMTIFGGLILSLYFIRLYLGWYDGQIWIKTPSILIQDKLIAEYQILPILNKIKVTLASFMTSVILGLIYING